MEVSLSKIINVTLLGTPQGLPGFNVNSLAIFTDETPGSGFGDDGYKVYYDPTGVAEDFGTDSDTYDHAVAVFSQNPNILSGGGYLVVVPLEELAEASAGTMLTLAPGSVETIEAIEDGAFTVSVDGTPQVLSNLDFSDCADEDAIAAVITAGLSGAVCTYVATANSNQGGYLITSSTTGVLSTVSKLSAPVGLELPYTDISGATYLNGAGNVRIINGQAAESAEDIISAIERTKLEIYYFGVITTTTPNVADTLNLAAFMQTEDKLLFIGRHLETDIDNVFKPVQEGTLTHTRCFYYTLGADEANQAVAAYASRLLGTNYSGSNTVSTMHLKTLAGVLPDPDAAASAIDLDAQAYGFDIYVSIAGDPGVISYGANVFSDEIYAQLWFKLALQVAGYNYLKTTNTKIPQTEPGMDGLKGAYADVCLQGVTNGYIGTGLTWTSPTTFGDPDDLRRNIVDAGFYIYSLPVSQQSPADRALRKAPLVQIAVKSAGAIHYSDVIAQVN